MGNIVQFSGLAEQLRQRENKGQPIRLGLVGCGEMGTDLLAAIGAIPGMHIAAINSRSPQRVLDAVKTIYQKEGYALEVHTASQLNCAIERGQIGICDSLDVLLENPYLDLIIDATGSPEAGAEIGYKTLHNNKHLVMMNVEADVTIGAFLNHEAEKKGLLYSLGAGDEPSACMELINFATALNYEIIAAGKGKNNPLCFTATPDAYQQEAAARNMNVRMLVEFIDGSKTMVEMASIANATGLVPDCAGMHGPQASLSQLANTLIPQQEGGILSSSGVVDYSIGTDIAPGVFVIVKPPHPRLAERMRDLKMGKGPYFTLYRPFHLTSLEVPLTCADMVLNKKPHFKPLSKPVAEVCAVAKKDLKAGEKLDFIGLYTYRAWTMKKSEAEKIKAIPCGLLENATITAPIKAGQIFTQDNTKINPNQWIVKLREEQDKWLATS